MKNMRKRISLKSPVWSSDVTKAVKRYKTFLKSWNNWFTKQKLDNTVNEITNKLIEHKKYIASTKLVCSPSYLESEIINAKKQIKSKYDEFFLTSNWYDFINGTEKFQKIWK